MRRANNFARGAQTQPGCPLPCLSTLSTPPLGRPLGVGAAPHCPPRTCRKAASNSAGSPDAADLVVSFVNVRDAVTQMVCIPCEFKCVTLPAALRYRKAEGRRRHLSVCMMDRVCPQPAPADRSGAVEEAQGRWMHGATVVNHCKNCNPGPISFMPWKFSVCGLARPAGLGQPALIQALGMQQRVSTPRSSAATLTGHLPTAPGSHSTQSEQ
jgi:hypothetical protein